MTDAKLQNLRDFTVQIKSPDHKQTIGTGFFISQNGEIATCLHIFTNSLGLKKENVHGAKIGVGYPSSTGTIKLFDAVVARYLREHDDDVVVLQLIDHQHPITPDQVPIIGDGNLSTGNSFRSYGYREVGDYSSGYAYGTILGSVESPKAKALLLEPLELDSKYINTGMSGAPILDIDRNLIVGMVTESWIDDFSRPATGLAWGLNARILSHSSFSITIQEKPLPLTPGREIPSDFFIGLPALEKRLDSIFFGAPAPVEKWVGRTSLSDHLIADWKSQQTKCISLVGFGGEGKSALALRFISNLNSSSTPPSGVFWWSFNEDPSPDNFFESLLRFMTQNRVSLSNFPGHYDLIRAIIAILVATNSKIIMVLDGLETQQTGASDYYGGFQNRSIRDFLELFLETNHSSFCLITSRLPLLDLVEYKNHQERFVDRLTNQEGTELLIKIGTRGENQDLENLVEYYKGHALALNLVGRYIKETFNNSASLFLKQIDDAQAESRDLLDKILAYYDGLLVSEERDFMMLLSLVKGPLSEDLINYLKADNYAGSIISNIANLEKEEYRNLIERLRYLNLIILDDNRKEITSHPLVYAFFLGLLKNERPDQYADALEDLVSYYRHKAKDVSPLPTLEQLKPHITLFRYLCQTNRFDEAYTFFYENLLGPENKWLLHHKLHANNTILDLLSLFYPDGDFFSEPIISGSIKKAFLLSTIGLSLTSTGNPERGLEILDKCYEMYSPSVLGDRNYARLCCDIAFASMLVGNLQDAADFAQDAIDELKTFYRSNVDMTPSEWESEGVWIFADTDKARTRLVDEVEHGAIDTKTMAAFYLGDAVAVQNTFENPKVPGSLIIYPFPFPSYALFLIRRNRIEEAKTYLSIEKNSGIKNRDDVHFSILNGLICCHEGNFNKALSSFEEGIKWAREVSDEDLIAFSIAEKATFLAKYLKSSDDLILTTLREAEVIAKRGGYRLILPTIHLGFGWAYVARGDSDKAKDYANLSLVESQAINYYWGRIDAEDFLNDLAGKE